MHNYNYVNTLWFGTVYFDSCSRFILCLYCFMYYVYDNPTYEVANKLICILYLVRPQFDFQHRCNVHNVSPWLCSKIVRHGHNTADTYGYSTSFTCVVKTHHQYQVTNTIPNTEVLQDCAQNGIPNFSLNGRNFFGPDTL